MKAATKIPKKIEGKPAQIKLLSFDEIILQKFEEKFYGLFIAIEQKLESNSELTKKEYSILKGTIFNSILLTLLVKLVPIFTKSNFLTRHNDNTFNIDGLYEGIYLMIEFVPKTSKVSVLTTEDSILDQALKIVFNPYIILANIFLLDKAVVRQFTIAEIKSAMNSYRRDPKLNFSVQKQLDRKEIFINQIRDTFLTLDLQKRNKSQLAKEMGYNINTFNDWLSRYEIKYDKNNGTFFDIKKNKLIV